MTQLLKAICRIVPGHKVVFCCSLKLFLCFPNVKVSNVRITFVLKFQSRVVVCNVQNLEIQVFKSGATVLNPAGLMI